MVQNPVDTTFQYFSKSCVCSHIIQKMKGLILCNALLFLQAFEGKVLKPVTQLMTQQQADWLQKVVEKPEIDHEELATFLLGMSRDEFVYSEQDYACLSILQPVSSCHQR